VARCSICGSKAVIELRGRRRRLCRDHFIEYFESRVESTLRKAGVSRGDVLLVAVSGGKDSASLLMSLSRLRVRIGYELVALHIDLGIDRYSRESRRAVEELASRLGVKLLIVSLRDLIGRGVNELASSARRPVCSVCGLVKRYVMNAAALELGARYIVVGHNADDIAAYAIKSFITQDLEALNKLGPSTPSLGEVAVGRIRPLYELSERESFVYALVTGCPFYHEECPNVDRTQLEIRIKEYFSKLESEKPGLRLTLVKKLARRHKEYPGMTGEIHECRHCGLISSSGECSFCRLTRKAVGRPMGALVRERIADMLRGIDAIPGA